MLQAETIKNLKTAKKYEDEMIEMHNKYQKEHECNTVWRDGYQFNECKK
jgi:hypothetical protein